MALITCPECEGSGAKKPDCWLCEGKLTIKIAHAVAEGYAEGDLVNAYDGECDCPIWGCEGDSCALCEGMGTITERERDDEVTRVLIFGITQNIPPQLSRGPSGRVSESDAYLFSFAGAECREEGWVRWYTSMLGDEIYLTPSGETEARSREWGWARRRDVTLGPIDDFGRFDDDGGPALPRGF